MEVAQKSYVTGNIFTVKEQWDSLESLPVSCVEGSDILQENRGKFEADGIFKEQLIDYYINKLKNEDDETMNQQLGDLPADDRLNETRKIMHKDLHGN